MVTIPLTEYEKLKDTIKNYEENCFKDYIEVRKYGDCYYSYILYAKTKENVIIDLEIEVKKLKNQLESNFKKFDKIPNWIKNIFI